MSKIDISNWHKFKIDNLFEKITTKKLPYKATQLPHHATEDNLIPLVTASVEHQGRSVYAPKTKDITVLSNCLTISANGYSGTTFYQDKPFSILQDAYAIQVKSSINENVSKYEYCFLASVIGKRLQQNDWINKATWNVVKAKEIRLPVTESDEPDWQYMDEYIAKLATQAHTNISLLRQQQKKAPTVNIDRWKEFKISDIYPIIQHPRTRSKKDYEQGSMPFIASGSTNNGIDCYLEPKDKNDYEKADCLTVSPVDGSCFYQSKPFLARGGGGSSILILRSKSKLNEAVHIFLATIITRKLKESYSFNTMGNSKSIANVKIKLPVTESDEPDWQYMDNYISSILQAQKERVARLTSIVKK